MMKIFLTIVGLIFVAIGVISIYDARKITTNLFSFQDKNEGTRYLKIFGVLIALLGMGIVYIYLPEIGLLIKNI